MEDSRLGSREKSPEVNLPTNKPALSEWHEGARDGSLSACETVLSDIVERYAHYARMGDQVEAARRFVEDQLVREFDAWIEANYRERLGLPPA